MSKPRKFSRWFLSAAALVLIGLVGWWINRPAAPNIASHDTKTTVASPSAGAPTASRLPNQTVPEKSAVAPAATPAPAPNPITAAFPATAPSTNTTQLNPPEKAARPADRKADAEVAARSGGLPTPRSGAQATARMYAAHATLRTPEVADPDSKANKQILQTMVLKALAESATPAPAIQAKN